ncbi:MAG: FAD-dependent oxidoreductase [Planctomycetes bacterium]|nr:FAD-dependent oxidoreductase [Planctomycetota bacterium]MBI3845350.1 FAD-dependent oxidoreductase [Planctomycetota bacterium]
MTHSRPPWFDGRLPSPSHRRLPLPTRVDVCVIGGGITGVSALDELAARNTRALLLERDRLATGATGDASIGARDPMATVEGIAARAEAAGCEIHEETTVRRIESTPEGPMRVVTTAGDVAAEIVIVAVNAWAAFVHDGFRESVAAFPAAMLATEPMHREVRAGSRDDGRLFFGPGPGGRFVFGAIRWTPLELDSIDRAPLDARGEGALRRAFAEACPDLATARVERTWPAIVAATCDGLPLVGPMPGNPRVVAAVGFSASDLDAGATAGRDVARAILGIGPTTLGHLSPRRLVVS